jgi:glycosyltransferase involved in cell wall biosynthesis
VRTSKGNVSIVIATFNSGHTLPLVLESIRCQTYPQENIEVLAVDGGSMDDTIALAENYGCRVISNPKTEPSMAKKLGFLEAKGPYIIYLDADEVLESSSSIERKVHLMKKFENLRVVTCSGYRTPTDGSFINYYINEFGDPFSFFVYRLSRADSHYLPAMCRNYKVVQESSDAVIFDFRSAERVPLLELAVMGTLFDLEYVKKKFGMMDLESLGHEFLAHLFYHLLPTDPWLAVLRNDPITHYSSDSVSKYLNKIRWRIKNNIYFTKSVGGTAYVRRDELTTQNSKLKRYLFIPYSFSIFFPLADAIWLSLTRKNWVMMAHLPLCIFTASQIILHMTLRMLGYKPKLRSYDESKIVE